MKKWEYKTAIYDIHNIIDTFNITGKDDKVFYIIDEGNKLLGEKGWELVSTSAIGDGKSPLKIIYSFKREANKVD